MSESESGLNKSNTNQKGVTWALKSSRSQLYHLYIIDLFLTLSTQNLFAHQDLRENELLLQEAGDLSYKVPAMLG